MREVKVVLLPGDGIGPEVIGEARRLVDHVSRLDDVQVDWDSHAVGGCAIDTFGTPLPDGVLEECEAADAVLLGAVGGPKWDTTNPDAARPLPWVSGPFGIAGGGIAIAYSCGADARSARVVRRVSCVSPFEMALDAFDHCA